MNSIAENLDHILGRINLAVQRAGRSPGSVKLVAVSKGKPASLTREAFEAGHLVFGENYLQEAEEKIAQLGKGPSWHFIGHLQSNKAGAAARLFDCIETIDRLKLAQALEKQLARLERKIAVLVQVNVGREPQKSGILPEEAEKLLRALQDFSHLEVRGLMTIPPYFPEPEKTRPYFRELKGLAVLLEEKGLLGRRYPTELSMGMSDDFEVAIEEGATLVRVGTALFGAR
jgi:hypothetical protein